MATKADFNAEEWSTIVQAPLLAGVRVVAAERGGALRESLAITKVYTAARQSQGDNALLDEVVASPPALDPQQMQGQGDAAAAVGQRVRSAVAALSEKSAPEDVEAYKQFVLAVARAAAEAHKEGGFVGIGGTPVSEKEQAALDEIERLLGSG